MKATDIDKIFSDFDKEFEDSEWDGLLVSDSIPKFVPTGVCHCGEPMDDHSVWGNHSPTDMADDSGYDDNHTLKGLQTKIAKNKAKKLLKTMQEMEAEVLKTGKPLKFDITAAWKEAKGFSYAETKPQSHPTKYSTTILGGDDLVSSGNVFLTKKTIQDMVDKMQSSNVTTALGSYLTMDELLYYPVPKDASTPDTDKAQDYLQGIGVGVTVLNGHKLENILATYSTYRNEQLSTRLEEMVAERVAAELQKQHKRNCIPTYRSKNDRKFRA